MKGDAWHDSPLFNEREKATIAWAEAVTRNTAKSDKALWDTMKRLFSDAEIVEITMASAMFNMINRLNDTFWTELETVEYNRRQGNARQRRHRRRHRELRQHLCRLGRGAAAGREFGRGGVALAIISCGCGR